MLCEKKVITGKEDLSFSLLNVNKLNYLLGKTTIEKDSRLTNGVKEGILEKVLEFTIVILVNRNRPNLIG